MVLFSPTVPYVVPRTTLEVCKHLGLMTSLVEVLDAGDSLSYDGSASQWSNQTGAGCNFHRGSGSGAEANDPTFNGVPGRQSSGEYFLLDGGDFFNQNGGISFASAWHHNNATFTFCAWVYFPGIPAATVGFFGNNGASFAHHGVGLWVNTAGNLRLAQFNGSGTTAGDFASGTGITVGQWRLYTFAINEAGTSYSGNNGALTDWAVAYVTPSAGGPSFGQALCASNSGGQRMAAGSAIANVAAWNRFLSKAEVLLYFEATKAKFGY